MLSALAARALTGPLAFFVAGCLDVGLFLIAVAVHRTRLRLRLRLRLRRALRQGRGRF